MGERNDYDNENDEKQLDEILLPGFRFHPTDEELVGFYLKRKIQQRPLSIELIKQLDIYKFDPWDLPKLATTGEKEWYFYCPRDRKYRNSARPNRVTGAGFWKATGTDRPIYSSEGNKCIGLKKSLVFYKGKAAKGIKTDWMMHEFRLPSLTDSLQPPKRFLDKTIPANDSWAICRIFKKTNSTAQRALSQSWVSPLPAETAAAKTSIYNTNSAAASAATTTADHHFTPSSIMNYLMNYNNFNNDHFQHHPSSSFSCLTTTASNGSNSNNNNNSSTFFPLDFAPYKSNNPMIIGKPHHHHHHYDSTGDLITSNFMFSSPMLESAAVAASKCNVNMQDVSSMLLDMHSSSNMLIGDFCKSSTEHSLAFGGSSQDYCSTTGNFSTATLPLTVISDNGGHHRQQSMINNLVDQEVHDQYQWDSCRSTGFPFSLPMGGTSVDVAAAEAWKQQHIASSSLWDSSSCPSDQMSTSIVSTTKCYT